MSVPSTAQDKLDNPCKGSDGLVVGEESTGGGGGGGGLFAVTPLQGCSYKEHRSVHLRLRVSLHMG